jgi:hypothetical protein
MGALRASAEERVRVEGVADGGEDGCGEVDAGDEGADEEKGRRRDDAVVARRECDRRGAAAEGS